MNFMNICFDTSLRTIYTYPGAVDTAKDGRFGAACLVKGGDECCSNMAERIVNIVASDWFIDGERHSAALLSWKCKSH